MSLEVLAGVLPLTDRFAELSFRFLIRCEVMNPLVIENFEKLLDRNPQTRFMSLYYEYMTLEIGPSSFNSSRVCLQDFYSSSVNFDLTMLQEIRGIPDHHRSMVVPLIFANKYHHVSNNKSFFTDGSTINASTGFGVFNEFHSASYQLQKPCSVYVAELAAIFYAVEQIASLPSDHYFIFTDSLSSLEAIRSMRPMKHSSYFLTEIRAKLSTLSNCSYTITLVWVPSHCSIPGNEKADSLAKVGAMEGDIFDRQIAFAEFFSITRQHVLTNWQQKWNESDLGRWLHSILPQVSNKPWFKGLDMSRDFIRVISRLMSNHYSLDSHFFRIGLAGSNLCACGSGYHDIDHVLWSCTLHCVARSELSASLRARGKQPMRPVRDILASRDLDYCNLIYVFLKRIDLRI